LDLEPTNTVALQLQVKVSQLENHQANFLSAMKNKEWTLARLALDQCLKAIEGEGGEIPTEWRIWRIELELARGNWDGANTSAK
jgi:DnaJ family protein C protein 7